MTVQPVVRFVSSRVLWFVCLASASTCLPFGSVAVAEETEGGGEQVNESASSEPLDGRDGRELLLRNFRPQTTLKVPAHHLKLLDRLGGAVWRVADQHAKQ